MNFTTIYRIYGEKGRLELEVVWDKLRATIIDGSKALDADIDARSLYEVLFNLVEEESSSRLLMEKRSTCYWSDRCSNIWVPDTGLIAHILIALRGVLARAPRPTKCYEEDSCEWLWSPKEAEAATKAAILLDLAAMLLRSPETVDKLPRDVDMLVKSYEENHSLDQFLKPRTEARAAEG